MATLEKIRSKAGLLVIVIGVALFAFIIGDFLNSGSTFMRQRGEKILSVNGEKLTVQDYEAKVQDLTEVYQIQFGQTSLPEEYQVQIRQSVYDNFIRETLYGDLFEKVGIAVSADELFDMIQGKNISPMVQQIPLFRNPQTGAFDRGALLNFLSMIDSKEAKESGQMDQYKKYWMFWEQMLVNQQKEAKLNALLSAAVGANKVDAKFAFDSNHNSVDFVYVAKPYAAISDSLVKVSDSDVKKLYKAQIERFKQDEIRNIAFLTMKIAPSADDINEVATQFNKVKDEFLTGANYIDLVNESSDVPYSNVFRSIASLDASSKEFALSGAATKDAGYTNNAYSAYRLVASTVASDSVRVRGIMVPASGDEKRDTQLLDSIQGLLKGSETFEQVATKLGMQNGGEIGWLTEENAIRVGNVEFKDKCFAAAPNSMFSVKLNQGTLITRVEEKTAPVKKVKLAVLSMSVTASSRTYSKLYNDINQVIAANKTADKFVKAAGEKNMQIVPAQPITAQEYTLANLKNSRQAVRWAFNADKGDVSQIFDCDGTFVVVAVNSISPKGYASFDEVKGRLSYEAINQKKGEMILADLKKSNPTSLTAYASAMGASRIDTARFVSFGAGRVMGLGFEPNLIAKATTAKEGALSQPIVGKSAVFVIDAVKKNSDEAKFDAAAEKQNLAANYMYRLMYQSFEILRNKADIEDNRVKFF